MFNFRVPILVATVTILSGFLLTEETLAQGLPVTFSDEASVDPGEIFKDSFESESIPFIDTDGDRLSDAAESNTGIFLNTDDTGTDPHNADTDGDGIKDGDEVLGTLEGLNLPAMGVSPLRKDLLLEYDWFDDSLECTSHSHRPSIATIASAHAAFANAPVANPGSLDGINLINDYGQGGVFTGGNKIDDSNGVIDGGVNGSEYRAHKAANFASNRKGYFRYVLLPHRYNTNSSSSGQAEYPGDDLIVSLYCSNTSNNVARTLLHEVGHNLFLHHGGNEKCNYKPNYNSVMNYAYQFPGVDDDCIPGGDGVLDYSTGSRIDLNENSLNEFNGMCGPDDPWDWNNSDIIENPVTWSINTKSTYSDEVSDCSGSLTTLRDHDDWGNIFFGGVADTIPSSMIAPEIITEQPIPIRYTKQGPE